MTNTGMSTWRHNIINGRNNNMPAITVIGKFDPIPPDMIGAVEVDTTSHGSFKDLSPFYLGPIDLPSGERCLKFENFWQYSKVYKQHTEQAGNPSPQYWAWRNQGFNSLKAARYPMGKGARPEYSLCPTGAQQKLGYIPARKTLYVPYFADLVRKTQSYAKIYNWFHSEKRDILLRDFDGYDHKSLGMTFKDVVNNPKHNMGHAFVIMAMITGELAFGLG